MDTPTEEIFIKCDCSSEGIHIQHDEELGFEISFWSFGHPSLGFKEKIRYIWRILWHGRPYGDMVILSPEKARMLADFIQTRTSK